MDGVWATLGRVDPTQLTETRMQVHYAAQIASGAGRTLLPKQPDDSHTNLGWVDGIAALAGRVITDRGARPVAAAIEIPGLRLSLLDEGRTTLAATELAGMTVADGYHWLGNQLAAHFGKKPADGFTPLHYELPNHPLRDAARFEMADPAAFRELAAWFANAAAMLEELCSREKGASAVRCWPHHFDIATLIEVDSERGSSVGAGLSPGDDSYDEPYWYVAPWPRPEGVELPALDAGGHWHTEGFTAAILTGTEALHGSRDQRSRVDRFLRFAVDESRRLVKRSPADK